MSREAPLRVLLSEASSLTAREHLTVLGAAGVRVELMSSDPLALGRWSRWARRIHRCPPPGTDPAGYLDAVGAVLNDGGFDALLPTHEQAWLFAVARDRLPPAAPVALAPVAAFAQAQSKIAFARLLDELGAPQPRWWPVPDGGALEAVPYPYFLKAAYSTAGQGVRAVRDHPERSRALAELRGSGELMAQAPAAGQYGQVQALFEHGRMVAAHTSVLAGQGAGGSAAARLSVDHPLARSWAGAVGRRLAWHGGLTMDYFHQDGHPVFIECNPRTVEPGNAAASGVSLPLLSIDLAAGRPLPGQVVTGRPGVLTSGTLALVLGAAGQAAPRRAVLRALADSARRDGACAGAEVLTPIVRDPPSLIPLLLVAVEALARPAAVTALTGRGVAAYTVTEQTLARLRPRPSAGD